MHREVVFTQGRSTPVPGRRTRSTDRGRPGQGCGGLCVNGRAVQEPHQRHAVYVQLSACLSCVYTRSNPFLCFCHL